MASLYLHIPFCERKCVYCDFYSIENLKVMDAFLASLKREIVLYANAGRRESFETIFFGGGTPSLLAPQTVSEILTLLRDTYVVTPDAEITMEANPGTVDRAKLEAYRSIGVNRLSFGVQSFHQDELDFLSRIHSADEARHALRWAREAGFDNLSLDLIFALPHQTMDRWKYNLDEAMALQTDHISAYSLIVEDGTPLARMVRSRQVSPLPIDAEAGMYEFTMAYLAERGFEHYEVSNYAKPGKRSRHNYNYWNHSNYLSFGPSAHSFWGTRRWWNIANISTYCEKLPAGVLPLAGEEELDARQLLEEAIMLGLRSDGIDLRRFTETYKVDLLETASHLVRRLVEEGLAQLVDNRLSLTDRGYLLCDEITMELLPSTPCAA